MNANQELDFSCEQLQLQSCQLNDVLTCLYGQRPFAELLRNSVLYEVANRTITNLASLALRRIHSENGLEAAI